MSYQILSLKDPEIEIQVIPQWKICSVCGVRFTKKPFRQISQWLKQKSCSKRCQVIRRRAIDSQPIRKMEGRRKLNTHALIFKCCLCGEEIHGGKAELKAHKYERHSH